MSQHNLIKRIKEHDEVNKILSQLVTTVITWFKGRWLISLRLASIQHSTPPNRKSIVSKPEVTCYHVYCSKPKFLWHCLWTGSLKLHVYVLRKEIGKYIQQLLSIINTEARYVIFYLVDMKWKWYPHQLFWTFYYRLPSFQCF